MPRPPKSRAMCTRLMIAGSILVFVLLVRVRADSKHPTSSEPEPVYISMEALHAAGGVPPGWQFTLPAGDPEAGREVFVTMQCYTCHAVAGETLPAYPPRQPGPDLTGMGAHHPAAYFAESIINPNAVIVTGEGYTGPDGRSRMPASHEITIAQLLDLVAYLRSLQGPAAHVHHGTMGHPHRPDQGHQHGGGSHDTHPHTQ